MRNSWIFSNSQLTHPTQFGFALYVLSSIWRKWSNFFVYAKCTASKRFSYGLSTTLPVLISIAALIVVEDVRHRYLTPDLSIVPIFS